MTLNMFWIGAAFATFTCFSAYAQAPVEPDEDAPVAQRVIADPDIVGAFYADEDMTKLAPPEELASQWNSMPPDLRNQIRAECASPADERENDLCNALNGFE
jgi:hypothetical protein